MKENEDKNIENLVEKMMKTQTLDTPRFDFTSKVMRQIEVEKQSQVFIYKPLISKQATLILSSLSLFIFGFYFTQNNLVASKWKIPIDFSTLFMFNFHFSSTTSYCLLIGFFMTISQIIWLKSYLDKKN